MTMIRRSRVASSGSRPCGLGVLGEFLGGYVAEQRPAADTVSHQVADEGAQSGLRPADVLPVVQ
jgi:hypothetical protein